MRKLVLYILIITSLSALLISAAPSPILQSEQPDKTPQDLSISGQFSVYFVNKIIYFNPKTLVFESPKLSVNRTVTAKINTTPRNQIKSGYFKPCNTCSTTYQWGLVEVMVPPPGKCRWTYTYDH